MGLSKCKLRDTMQFLCQQCCTYCTRVSVRLVPALGILKVEQNTYSHFCDKNILGRPLFIRGNDLLHCLCYYVNLTSAAAQQIRSKPLVAFEVCTTTGGPGLGGGVGVFKI